MFSPISTIEADREKWPYLNDNTLHFLQEMEACLFSVMVIAAMNRTLEATQIRGGREGR